MKEYCLVKYVNVQAADKTNPTWRIIKSFASRSVSIISSIHLFAIADKLNNANLFIKSVNLWLFVSVSDNNWFLVALNSKTQNDNSSKTCQKVTNIPA
jgi:hypothetical protein